MKKFSYVEHIFEIVRVAEKLPCDIGEAWDRFRADVEAGEAHDYNTGDILEYFDFGYAGKLWNAMTKEEQEQAREDWRKVMRKPTGAYNHDLVIELHKAYREWEDKWTF